MAKKKKKSRLNPAQERQKKDVQAACMAKGGDPKECMKLGFAVSQSKTRGTKKRR